jgi:hypothetical protein
VAGQSTVFGEETECHGSSDLELIAAVAVRREDALRQSQAEALAARREVEALRRLHPPG